MEIPSRWQKLDNMILRDFQFLSFRQVLEIVNIIGEIAEEKDHHPDILIHDYKKLRVYLTTHEVGNITQVDIEMAKKIEEKVEEYIKSNN